MAETRSHKRIKNKMAGPGGRTEVKLPSGRRLDAVSGTRIATEVERQGKKGIQKAVSRLSEAKKTHTASGVKIAVPRKDMGEAIREMRKQGVKGRVQSLSNNHAYYVGAPSKPGTKVKNRDSSRPRSSGYGGGGTKSSNRSHRARRRS